MIKRTAFVDAVWAYYGAHGRHDLPWRQPEKDGQFDPYKILVSEIMLQQTQVNRVIPKYQEFLQTFPSINDLAQAKLGEVLRVWSGLGYNRRAKFLWQAAQTAVKHYTGKIPATAKQLTSLPGIGTNTAGAIITYAFDQPVAFIETNIRTVFIHHFLKDKNKISDVKLLPIVQATWDEAKPREFGWALMDYGSYLKATVGNTATRSQHHAKQSKFEGSVRQIRGQVLRLLTMQPHSRRQLQQAIHDSRLVQVLHDLEVEGLIRHNRQRYDLT